MDGLELAVGHLGEIEDNFRSGLEGFGINPAVAPVKEHVTDGAGTHDESVPARRVISLHVTRQPGGHDMGHHMRGSRGLCRPPAALTTGGGVPGRRTTGSHAQVFRNRGDKYLKALQPGDEFVRSGARRAPVNRRPRSLVRRRTTAVGLLDRFTLDRRVRLLGVRLSNLGKSSNTAHTGGVEYDAAAACAF